MKTGSLQFFSCVAQSKDLNVPVEGMRATEFQWNKTQARLKCECLIYMFDSL